MGRRKGREGKVRTGRARVNRREEGANMVTQIQKNVDRQCWRRGLERRAWPIGCIKIDVM